MFFFERKRETVDDGPQDLQKLRNAVESLSLVNKLEKDIIYGAPNIGPQIQEFAIYPVKGRLEKVPLSGIFGIEKFEELERSIRDGMRSTY